MKTIKSFLILLFSLLFTSATIKEADGWKIPSADVKTLDGKNFNTSKISNDGKPIIICVWETTCKPCINELDAIAEQYDSLKKETGVKLVAVSIDDSKTSSKVSALVNSKAWSYEIYLDKNRDFKRALNINYCPYTFLVDGNGEIVWEKSSYSSGDENKIYELVKKLAKGEKVDGQ